MVSGTEDLTSGTDPPRNSRSLLASLAPSCAHPPVPSLVYQTNGKVRQSLEGGKVIVKIVKIGLIVTELELLTYNFP